MENRSVPEHVPVDKVCAMRDYYIPHFSEGNPILKDILDYTTDAYLHDQSIAPFECCEGHDYCRDTFVMFNIKYGHDYYIHNILESICHFDEVSYALGQDYANNTILFSIRLPFYDREQADNFLGCIKSGLLKAKTNYEQRPEIKNMLFLLNNVKHPDYQLVLKKLHYFEDDNLYTGYVASLYKTDERLLVNRFDSSAQWLYSLEKIITLKPSDIKTDDPQYVIS